MNRYEEVILKLFIEKNKVKEGSFIAAALIQKEKGINLEDLYEAALSLKAQDFVEIKSFTRGEIGDSKAALAFRIELIEKGVDYIKVELDK